MEKHIARKLAYYYALLFATPRLASLHYFFFKMALRGLGVMNYYDHKVSGEEFFISKLLPRLMHNHSPVFFDVGAHHGKYSQMLAKNFPNARIFAFEPHPGNYKVLAKTKIRNLTPFDLALSNTRGDVKLYDFAGTAGSTNASLYQGVINDIHHRADGAFAVKTDTLNSVVALMGLEHIDLLKIDTEGSELSILEGGKTLLQQNRVDIIQFEFNEMNVFSNSFMHSFTNLLKNFLLFRMLPRGLLPLPTSPLLTELFGFQNILAVSREKAHIL